MAEIINGAPVPFKIEAQGREAVAEWYEKKGRYHKDHVTPLTKEENEARLAAIAAAASPAPEENEDADEEVEEVEELEKTAEGEE